MTSIHEYFHDIHQYISRDYKSYQRYIAEYPYLKRLISFFLIFSLSFLWLVCFNVPLLWKLGWVFDVLQGIAVIGMVVGVFGILGPYIFLENNPPPYSKLFRSTKPKDKPKTQKKISHQPSSFWPISLSVVIDRRNRIERLQDQINNQITSEPTESIYESIRKMKNDDYLITSIKNKPKSFVQFLKMTGAIRLELPLVNNPNNRGILNQAIQLVKSRNVYKGFQLFNIPLCPSSYYFIEHWSDESNKVRGKVLVVICKNNLLLAVEVGLTFLEHIYHWNKKSPLTCHVDSFDTSWCNKW